jgi:G3E family GTPase
MLNNIPTHLIAGPLGAGKTSLIRNLLAQRPAHERWAVLINEFGLIGLDAALLTTGLLSVRWPVAVCAVLTVCRFRLA